MDANLVALVQDERKIPIDQEQRHEYLNLQLVKALGARTWTFDPVGVTCLFGLYKYLDPKLCRDGITESEVYGILAQHGVVSRIREGGILQVRKLLDGKSLLIPYWIPWIPALRQYQFKRINLPNGEPGYIAKHSQW